MLGREGSWEDACKRAWELFHEQFQGAKGSPSIQTCLWVAQMVGDEYSLPGSTRAWLTKELLVEAVVHKTLKELLKGEVSTEALEGLLSQEIEHVGAALPAGLKDALFAWMLRDRCAALLQEVYGRIYARVKRGIGT